MQQLLLVTVGIGLTSSAAASLLPWESRQSDAWTPAKETLAPAPEEYGPEPAPTSAPDLAHGDTLVELAKRQAGASVCGYISGIPALGLECPAGGRCVYNSYYSLIDCCAFTTCSIGPTTCLDRTDSYLYTDSVLQSICSSAAYPHCANYVMSGGPRSGYTWYGCEAVPTRRTAFPTAFAVVTVTESIARGGPSGSTPTPSPPPSPLPIETSTGANAGAIAGGVIGGVLGLAVIGLGIFFLMRSQRKNGDGSPSQATATGMYATPEAPPPVQQVDSSQPSGFPPTIYGVDKGTSSTVASTYDPRMSTYPPSTVSPTASSMPQSDPSGAPFQPFPQTYSPPYQQPVYQQPTSQQQPPQQSYGQSPPQAVSPVQQSPAAVELSVVRGDGQLRELQ